MSGAAHKHLVIILAGSPVTSEYTECTTHDDVLRPSTVTGHTLTSLQHTNTQTHKMPFYPFCLCNGPVEGRSESDNLILTLKRQKGNRISLPHKHQAQHTSNTTGNEMLQLPLSMRFCGFESNTDTDRGLVDSKPAVWNVSPEAGLYI